MQNPATTSAKSRPWIGVNFVCAGAYRRVFRDAKATAYQARCPKCSACVRFRVEPGGSNERFYEVTCDGNWPT